MASKEDSSSTTIDLMSIPGTASLAEMVDTPVMVLLRDGRKIIGVLRSYDQFVLQDCVERFYVNETFADVDHPVFLVRGESVVLIGEIDDENIEQKPLKKAPASKVLPLVDEQLRQRKHDELQQTVAQARRGLCRTVVDMADFY